MLHDLSKSVGGRLLAMSLVVILPACSLFSSVTGRSGPNVNLSGSLSAKVRVPGPGVPGLAAVGNTATLIRSGNIGALTAAAVSLGIPAAIMLGRMAVKAIQNEVTRRAEERALKLQATQLFYAGQCKLDVQPTAATGNDAAGLEAQAEQAFSKGEYAQAESFLQKAVEKRQNEKGGEAALGRVLNRQAALYLAMSQLDKVEPPGQRSLDVREKALGKDNPDVAESLSTLAALYQQKSDFGRAEPLLQRALKIREKALKEDHICVAQSVNQLAGLYKDMGAYSKAEPLYQRALSIRESKLGADSLDVAQSQSDVGGLYLAMGNYAAAEPYYIKALDVRQAKLGNDSPEVAETLNELGNLYRRRGSFPLAEARYRQALAIREKKLQPSDPRIAESLGDLAALYTSLGDTKSAEPLLRRALDLRQKTLGNDSPEVAESLVQLALLAEARGELGEAETLLNQSLTIREKKLTTWHPSVAESTSALGDLYLLKGDVAKADAAYQRTLTIRQKVFGAETPQVADALYRLATVARARGDLTKAESQFQQALTLREKLLGPSHPDVAESLLGLAAVQVGKGQTAAAIPLFDRALQINETILHSISGSSNEARIDGFLRSVRAEEDLTYSLLAEKSPSDATVALAATTALLRKGRSVDEAADTSRAIFQGLGPEEQQKLASLREVRSRRADLALAGSGVYPPDVYQKLLKDLQDSEERQQQELLKSSASLRQRLNENGPAQVLADVQKILPEDAALVEFLAYRQWNFKPTQQQPQSGPGAVRYAALVLKPDGKPQAFDLGPGADVDAAVSALLNDLTNAESDWQPSAKKLSEMILKPLAGVIGDRKRLYISPDGQLNLIPFAVLSAEKGLLVDNYDMTYLTSGRDFLRKPGAPPKDTPKTSVALLADPQFSVDSKSAEEAPPVRGLYRGLRLGKVAPLPGTREEAKAIEKLMKKVDVKAFYGGEATKREFLHIEQPSILHVATHGLFLGDTSHGGQDARGMTLEDDEGAPAQKTPAKGTPAAKPTDAKPAVAATPKPAYSDNPLLASMLVLSGAETASHIPPEKRDPALGNGLVTALEVASMNLWGTQLVVLSACETGRGDVSSLGQGVYGLRRAVMVAGAETLLTSLWKVDDKATRDLMTKYYQNLLKGHGRGESMREAALGLRKKHPHPYYWAPFINIGRSGPLTIVTKAKKGAAAADDSKDDDG